MKHGTLFLIIIAVACLVLSFVGCEKNGDVGPGSDADSDTDSDTDGDTDSDTDGDTDSDTDTETHYEGPAIPETCAQAEQALTTVGCLFYAVDLDSVNQGGQYAIAVSNVNQSDTAHVIVHKGNSSLGIWEVQDTMDVLPMDLHTFNLPDHHQESSGFMIKGSYKVESDVPIIAYQFNPVDGSASYLSDASMLIPKPSLSATYDVIGWRQNTASCASDGDMRAYFTVVATTDGTLITVEPSMAPIAGDQVPASTTPFTVSMNEGDVLEVATANNNDTMSGSRITSNSGDHPIAVFTGQQCAYIPADMCACDHLEEQMPGLRFWGTDYVGARLPVRSVAATTEPTRWQIYVSENNTQITLTASAGVVGLPFGTATHNQGDLIEFFVAGTQAEPGDFHISADKPIGVMQYMVGEEFDNTGIGDPAMVYTSPTEQFLTRYVVLVPTTWINDALVITREAGATILLNGTAIAEADFVAVGATGFDVARIPVPDGIHSLESEDGESGLAVIVIGWDSYDSYAYIGGMGMGAINPIIE